MNRTLSQLQVAAIFIKIGNRFKSASNIKEPIKKMPINLNALSRGTSGKGHLCISQVPPI